MLKRFTPHCTMLDGEWNEDSLEDFMISTLEARQVGANTDEELKKNCYPLLKKWADSKNMTVDEYYDYLLKKYPYNEERSCWYGYTDEELKFYAERYRKPMEG